MDLDACFDVIKAGAEYVMVEDEISIKITTQHKFL